LFSENPSLGNQTLNSTVSGDAAPNECMLQPTIHDLPFGGVGNSGVGKYHVEWGFRAYLNARGVLSQSKKIDIGGLRYPPYDHNRILREIVMPS
jgi:aldehyde dehydrogenase (NAD+)